VAEHFHDDQAVLVVDETGDHAEAGRGGAERRADACCGACRMAPEATATTSRLRPRQPPRRCPPACAGLRTSRPALPVNSRPNAKAGSGKSKG
jgi:hypothetical protein